MTSTYKYRILKRLRTQGLKLLHYGFEVSSNFLMGEFQASFGRFFLNCLSIHEGSTYPGPVLFRILFHNALGKSALEPNMLHLRIQELHSTYAPSWIPQAHSFSGPTCKVTKLAPSPDQERKAQLARCNSSFQRAHLFESQTAPDVFHEQILISPDENNDCCTPQLPTSVPGLVGRRHGKSHAKPQVRG